MEVVDVVVQSSTIEAAVEEVLGGATVQPIPPTALPGTPHLTADGAVDDVPPPAMSELRPESLLSHPSGGGDSSSGRASRRGGTPAARRRERCSQQRSREYEAMQKRAVDFLQYVAIAVDAASALAPTVPSSSSWSLRPDMIAASAAGLETRRERADAIIAAVSATTELVPDDAVAVAQSVSWLVDSVVSVHTHPGQAPQLHPFPRSRNDYPLLEYRR